MKAELHFSTPIYSSFDDRFVKPLNKISDNLILKSKKENIKVLKDREKGIGKKIGDHGFSYQSDSLISNKNFDDFKNYIGELSVAVLDSQGYNLKEHVLFFKELWVQQFAEKGGGHHSTHVHFNSHLSGFYFLKASDKTPFPIFHDPRVGKDMIQLPRKNVNALDTSNDMVHFRIKPGSLIIFPSYLPHEFDIDHGVDTFRFIHFNMQAISKDVL
jgi:uncharacterized protein (TIGR02466 family)